MLSVCCLVLLTVLQPEPLSNPPKTFYLVVQRGCASVASLLVHGSDQRPLVGLGLVPFGRAEPRVPVKPPHGVDVVVEHGDADVAAPRVHGRDLVPRFLQRVEPLDAVEVIHAVEPSDNVDEAFQKSGAVVGAGALLLARHVHPLVRAGVVGLDGVGRAPPAPAPDGKEDGVGQARPGEGIDEVRNRGAVGAEVVHGRQRVDDDGLAVLVVLHVIVHFDFLHEVVCLHQRQSNLKTQAEVRVLVLK